MPSNPSGCSMGGRPKRTPRTRGRNSLGLALSYVVALYMRDVRKQLQHQIGDELARHIPVLVPGIEQGHIEHHDAGTPALRDVLPFSKNLVVIPSEPIDALDHDRIARFEAPHQPLVPRALEITAARLVCVDARRLDAESAQRIDLTSKVLVA